MTEQMALAKSEQKHPLVEQLDKRHQALAEMLPGGEDAARRFRRVVVQAVVKNPDLMRCEPGSIVSAVMESATIGIEPTGTLGGAYLVPYGQKATLIVGYRGLIELARRSGQIETIEARVVRQGDEFSYAYGTDPHVTHTPNLDSSADMTHVYAVAKLRGGGVQFEVMTRDQVDAIRGRSRAGKSGPWATDYEEMARKTVVRRLVKYLPIAVEARDVIERDDEREFDHGAVVARVSADDRASQARRKIAERTAALRGEQIEQGESEAVSDDGAVPGRQPSHNGGSPVEEPAYQGEVLDIDDVPFDDGTQPRAVDDWQPREEKGDPWMRRIYAVGAERGMSHEDLHDRAAEWFGVDSMSALDASERAEMLDRVEAIEHAEQGNPTGDDGLSSGATEDPSPAPQTHAGEAAPVDARPSAPPTDTPDEEGSTSDAGDGPDPATAQPESSPAPAAPAQITDPDTLRTYAAAVLGYELDDVWGLGDLKPADWDQVWESLGIADHEAYAAWYGDLKRPLRQALMSAGQSPRKRKDAAIAAEAEQAIERVKAGSS